MNAKISLGPFIIFLFREDVFGRSLLFVVLLESLLNQKVIINEFHLVPFPGLLKVAEMEYLHPYQQPVDKLPLSGLLLETWQLHASHPALDSDLQILFSKCHTQTLSQILPLLA